jgi:hypothetical protein
MFAGIDSHKATLAIAVIDDAGRLQLPIELDNNSRGHDQLIKTLANAGVLRVGVEGASPADRAIYAKVMFRNDPSGGIGAPTVDVSNTPASAPGCNCAGDWSTPRLFLQ